MIRSRRYNCQSRYATFLIFDIIFLWSTATVSSAPASPKLLLSVTPDTLVENQPVTLTCQGRGAERFHYMELLDDKRRVLLHQYEEDVTELRGPWKHRTVDRIFDRLAMKLTVKFFATPSDNGIITCRLQVDLYPHDKNDLRARVRLNVQRPPTVLDFSLKRATPQGFFSSPFNQFVEGSNIQATCRVDLGHPEAAVTLETLGKVEMAQERLRIEADKYNYNVSTEQKMVQVSHLQDGVVFHCKASNEHEDLDRKIKIAVLYRVRDLVFPYSNGTTIEVGSTISCLARGNPSPAINLTAIPLNITVRRNARALQWTRPFRLPFGRSEIKIPEEAPEGQYKIMCEASNSVANQKHFQRSSPVLVRLTADKKRSWSLIIMGIVLGVLLFIIILFILIKCKKNKEPCNKKKRKEGMTTETIGGNNPRANIEETPQGKGGDGTLPMRKMEQESTDSSFQLQEADPHKTEEDGLLLNH